MSASGATLFTIPTSGGPQTFSTQLGDTTYELTFQYINAGTPCWVLSIADVTGSPLISGIPLVTGEDLLGQFAYVGIKGILFVLNPADMFAPPTFDNFGVDCLLYFAPHT